MGVSPTSWVMSSATRSRVPSIVFILTVQSTGGEMEASTAGGGPGVGGRLRASGFPRTSSFLILSHANNLLFAGNTGALGESMFFVLQNDNTGLPAAVAGERRWFAPAGPAGADARPPLL